MTDQRTEATVEDVILRLTHSHLEPYYNWLRQILGLSSGALTLLVSLQGTYIPAHPLGLPLLQLCWGSLAASVVASLLALYGGSAIPLGAANHLRRLVASKGREFATKYMREKGSAMPPRIYTWSKATATLCFAIAVVLMASFAMINLSHHQ